MAVTSRQGGGQFKLLSDSSPMKYLCGTKGIKIWTNIKMQTGIKYIPALGSFMVRDYLKQTVHLRKNTNVRNAAEK